MVIEPPDIDPECTGMASYLIDSVCHVAPSYYDDGQQLHKTECNITLDDDPMFDDRVDSQGPRHEYSDEPDVEMCNDFWPSEII